MTAYLGKWWHMYEFLTCQENKCLTLGLLSVNEILVTMMKRTLRILKDLKRTFSRMLNLLFQHPIEKETEAGEGAMTCPGMSGY